MSRRAVYAALVDVGAIILFVVLGRSSHDEGGNVLTGTLKVAAPFLIALAIGWLVSRAWTAPTAPVPTGIVIWLVTIVGGMVLRHFAFDRGTAMPFIIVASAFTLLFLVGWRLLLEWWSGRRAGAEER